MEVKQIIERMSVEEKVGQLFMLAFESDRLEEARVLIENYFVGGCYISNENAPTVRDAFKLVSTLQGFALTSSVKVPLILGVDQEGAWGVIVPESTTGPGNFALGSGAGDPDLTYKMYGIFGREMVSVGYNTVLAPCADVMVNPDNTIIGVRSFGQVPELVAEHTRGAVRGLKDSGAIATAKHFPGHGDTSIDSHRDLPVVNRDWDELKRIELLPFQAAIEAGVDVIMSAHIVFPKLDPDNPATMSKVILEKILREEMGFEGIILSDSMNMGAIKKHYPTVEAVIRAIDAGIDMIMLAEEHYDHDRERYLNNQISIVKGVIDAVREGKISEDRLNLSLRRILRLKSKINIPKRLENALMTVGAKAHRDVERTISLKAVKILRDDNNLLPVKREESVAVVNASKRESYKILTQTRGIGPNQLKPAFDSFRDEWMKLHENTVFVSAEEILGETHRCREILDKVDKVLVIVEDYPLPGVDFDRSSNWGVLEIIRSYSEKSILVLLYAPFILGSYDTEFSVVCSFSSRECAGRAAADVVVGAFSS